jgi:hypothetical protein
MTHNNQLNVNFIDKWLADKKSEGNLDKSILELIEHHLSGIDKSQLAEEDLLKALMNMGNQSGGKNDED